MNHVIYICEYPIALFLWEILEINERLGMVQQFKKDDWISLRTTSSVEFTLHCSHPSVHICYSNLDTAASQPQMLKTQQPSSHWRGDKGLELSKKPYHQRLSMFRLFGCSLENPPSQHLSFLDLTQSLFNIPRVFISITVLLYMHYFHSKGSTYF